MAVDGRKPFKIVPVVAPVSADPNTSGKVRNLACGGGVCHRQVVLQDDGSYEMVPSWQRKGWRLLKDMYLEENNAEGWALYERYLSQWAKAQTRSPFPISRLPAAVQERQRCMLPDEFAADDFRVAPTTGAPVEPEQAKSETAARKPKPEAR